MGLNTKHVTATVRQDPNQSVGGVSQRSVGLRGIVGDQNVEGKLLGVSGPKGDTGDQGPQGLPGLIGPEGPVGLNWTGEYDPGRIYVRRDGVFYAGSSYIYINSNNVSGIAPPDPLYWSVLASSATGGDKTFVHVQNVAESTWTITHSLAKFPSVSIIDTGDNIVEGCIQYIDANTVSIEFSAPFTGRAYFN